MPRSVGRETDETPAPPASITPPRPTPSPATPPPGPSPPPLPAPMDAKPTDPPPIPRPTPPNAPNTTQRPLPAPMDAKPTDPRSISRPSRRLGRVRGGGTLRCLMPTSASLGAAGEFAASHHGVIPRSQAARLGLTPSALRSLVARGVLLGPRHGSYVIAGCPPTWHQRVASVTLGHRGDCLVSHRAAGALHQLDGLPEGVLELLVTHGSRVAGGGAIVHQTRTLPRCDIVTIRGIPATGLARTLCDLGDVVDEGRVLRALDDAQRRGTEPALAPRDRDTTRHPTAAGPTHPPAAARSANRWVPAAGVVVRTAPRRRARVPGAARSGAPA